MFRTSISSKAQKLLQKPIFTYTHYDQIMLRKITLFALFLVSYVPLFLILAVQNARTKFIYISAGEIDYASMIRSNKLPIAFLLVSVFSLVYYWFFIKVNDSAGFRNPKRITKIKNTGVEYLSYLATYIIPFIGLRFDTWPNLIATGLLFLVIGFIYTKTNLLYANPTLALFGYYIYQATFEGEEEKTIISKGKLKRNKEYRYKELSEDIYYIKT